MQENFKPSKSVPKTPEEELQLLIEATDHVFKSAPFMKSNPLVTIWREGNLNMNFIMAEIELIAQKKSKLSAGKREAVEALVAQAIYQFQARQQEAVQKETSDNASEEQDNESSNSENVNEL